jgi:hypothetical protein
MGSCAPCARRFLHDPMISPVLRLAMETRDPARSLPPCVRSSIAARWVEGDTGIAPARAPCWPCSRQAPATRSNCGVHRVPDLTGPAAGLSTSSFRSASRSIFTRPFRARYKMTAGNSAGAICCRTDDSAQRSQAKQRRASSQILLQAARATMGSSVQFSGRPAPSRSRERPESAQLRRPGASGRRTGVHPSSPFVGRR